MATPKDRASEPARKLVMDKSKLMPTLATPEEETVRNYRMKHGKQKLEEVRSLASEPKSSVDVHDPSFDRAHKGKRQGPRLPAAMPAKPKPEVIKQEKPLKAHAAGEPAKKAVLSFAGYNQKRKDGGLAPATQAQYEKYLGTQK